MPLPPAGSQPDNAVAFAVAARVAGFRADATWPGAIQGTAVPYQDYDCNTVAWMFHYRVDGQPFPADYEQVVREGQEDVTRFEAALATEPDAGSAPPTGRFRYAHVLVSARADRAPVLAWGEGLSEFYTRLEPSRASAAQLLGGEPGLTRIIADGLASWFEFSSGSRSVVIHSHLPTVSEDAAGFFAEHRQAHAQVEADRLARLGRTAAERDAELRPQYEAAWQAALDGSPPTDAQFFVTDYGQAPYFDWSFGCTPTSAAMTIGWYDKARHYGRMVDWHYQRRDALENEEDYNVPNCQLELAVAMATDTLGGSTPYENIGLGLLDITNRVNLYAFTAPSFNSNGASDWCWPQAQGAIAGNCPFIWSYDPPGSGNAHTEAVFGVDDAAKAYWVHTTWGTPGEWQHYSRGGDVDYTQVDIVQSLTADPNTYVALTQPRGDIRYNANGLGEVWHAWGRRYVTWNSPQFDSARVFVSIDAGRPGSWAPCGATTGSSMGFDLDPLWTSDSARFRVIIYDGGAVTPNTAGDGSWGNFRIVNTAPPAPTITYPGNNAAHKRRMPVRPTHYVHDIYYATQYQFELHNSVMGDFSSGWIADTSWRSPETLPIGSSGYWRCQARNPTGTSAWSQANYTVIAEDGWAYKRYVMTRHRAVKKGGAVAHRRRRRIRRMLDEEDDEIVYLLPGNNTRDFLRYSAWEDSWAMACSMPAGPRNKKVKAGAALMAEEDFVYAFKGARTNEFYRYDPTADKWDSLPGPSFAKGMKYGFSAMVEHEDSSRFVYAGSGNYSEWGIFDVDGNRWVAPTPALLPVEKAKAGSGFAWDGADRLYFLVGGSKENDFFVLDMSSSSPAWQKLAGLPLYGPSGKKKKAKEGAGIAWFQDRVYAVKGGNTLEFWRYTPGTDQWEYVNDVGAGMAQPPTKGIKCAQPLAVGLWGIYVLIGNNTNEFFYYAGDPPEGDGGRAAEPGRSGVASATTAAGPGIDFVANPVRGDEAALRWTGARRGVARVSVFDASGRCALRQAAVARHDATLRLDVSGLAAGVYLVRVDAAGAGHTGKLVIQR
jgi:hypothetical protein